AAQRRHLLAPGGVDIHMAGRAGHHSAADGGEFELPFVANSFHQGEAVRGIDREFGSIAVGDVNLRHRQVSKTCGSGSASPSYYRDACKLAIRAGVAGPGMRPVGASSPATQSTKTRSLLDRCRFGG